MITIIFSIPVDIILTLWRKLRARNYMI